MRTLEDMVTEVLTSGLPAIGHWATVLPGRSIPTVLVDEDDDDVEYAVTREGVTEALRSIALSDAAAMSLSRGTRHFVREMLFGRTDKPVEPEVADEVIQVALFGEVYWT